MNVQHCSPLMNTKMMFWLLTIPLLNSVCHINSLRLTEMNTPLAVDFRDEMKLECKFDMGDEELYAVKWYKDEQEFFRFVPSREPKILSFAVRGVHLNADGTNCTISYCTVVLKNLSRVYSNGAYRCEVSSEAPSFRLVSETHNVTVAALTRENPRIESLTTSYGEGDIVEAKCVSDPADPTPILSWHINGQAIPSKYTTSNITSTSLHLISRSLFLRFPVLADQNYSQGTSLEFDCMSFQPGIPLASQRATLTIPKRQESQVINNEMLHWFHSRSSANSSRIASVLLNLLKWTFVLCVVL